MTVPRDDVHRLSIEELGRAYRNGELTPSDAVEAYLSRMDRYGQELNAYIHVMEESARSGAVAMTRLLNTGVDLGPLHGIPLSVKDLFHMKGTRTTAASRLRADAPIDETDASAVEALRRAGAIFLGKTNLHEFAAGVPDPEPFGPVQNPRRHGYQPGSSSSGSAAAVTAGLCAGSIGTDTAQSIRVPAALCGVVGFKPTLGVISTKGTVPLSHTLDHVGVLGRTVPDVRVMYRSLAGDVAGSASTGGRTLRVGVPRGRFFADAAPEVLDNLQRLVKIADSCGHDVREVELPGVEDGPALLQDIIQFEAAEYHERYRGREAEYGRSFRDFMLPGREISAARYAEALRRARELTRVWNAELTRDADIVLTPCVPCEAPPHGVDFVRVGGTDRFFRMYCSQFVRPFSLVGFPALSIPSGVGASGLPTAVQIVGRLNADLTVLGLGSELEATLRATDQYVPSPIDPLDGEPSRRSE